MDNAIAYAQQLIANGSPVRRIRDEEDIVAADRDNAEIFDNARKTAARKMRKRFAPEMIVQCVEAAVNLGDFDAGIKVEQESFEVFETPPTRIADPYVLRRTRSRKDPRCA